MKAFVTLACLAVLTSASVASAECQRGPNGRVVCGNGNEAAGYNPNTGNAYKVEQNPGGVKTYQNSRGAEAATKNGMGVVKTPDGTVCVKGKNQAGCR